MTSNHGGHKNNMKASTVEKKGFQKVPLPFSAHIGAIYTIRYKYGLIRPF